MLVGKVLVANFGGCIDFGLPSSARHKFLKTENGVLESVITIDAVGIDDQIGRVDVSPNHLSQIINQYEQKNFYDFVNAYRVEEFIQQASENPHLSILAVALDAGFNSKSSFNSVFKKHKGITPSKYMADQTA